MQRILACQVRFDETTQEWSAYAPNSESMACLNTGLYVFPVSHCWKTAVPSHNHSPSVYELTKVVVTYTMPKLDYASLHLYRTNFQTSQWTVRLGDYVFRYLISLCEHQHLVLSKEVQIQHLSPTAFQEQQHLPRKDDINSD